MKAIPGAINIWESLGELEQRRDAGRQLAQKLFPGDSKWENRLINLAQGISEANWLLIQNLGKDTLERVVQDMINSGAPFDSEPRFVEFV